MKRSSVLRKPSRPLLERKNPLGLVVEDGSDVEGILVVDDPDYGQLRRRTALHRLLLREIRDGDGPLPRLLVKTSIYVDAGPTLQLKRDEIVWVGVTVPTDELLGRERIRQ